jgi:hypothetical protein
MPPTAAALSSASASAIRAITVARRAGIAVNEAVMTAVVKQLVQPDAPATSWGNAAALLAAERDALVQHPVSAALLVNRLRVPPSAWYVAVAAFAAAQQSGAPLHQLGGLSLQHVMLNVSIPRVEWRAMLGVYQQATDSGRFRQVEPRLRQLVFSALLHNEHGWQRAVRWHQHVVRQRDPLNAVSTGHLARVLERRGQWWPAAQVLQQASDHLASHAMQPRVREMQHSAPHAHLRRQWSEAVGISVNALMPVSWQYGLATLLRTLDRLPFVEYSGQVLRALEHLPRGVKAAAMDRGDAGKRLSVGPSVMRMASVGHWQQGIALLLQSVATLSVAAELRCRSMLLHAMTKHRVPWTRALAVANGLVALRNVPAADDDYKHAVFSALNFDAWHVALRLARGRFGARQYPDGVLNDLMLSSMPWAAGLALLREVWPHTPDAVDRQLLLSTCAETCFRSGAHAVANQIVERMIARGMACKSSVLPSMHKALYAKAAAQCLIETGAVVSAVRNMGWSNWQHAVWMVSTAVLHATGTGQPGNAIAPTTLVAEDQQQFVTSELFEVFRASTTVSWRCALALLLRSRDAPGFPFGARATVMTTRAVTAVLQHCAVEGSEAGVRAVLAAARDAAVVVYPPKMQTFLRTPLVAADWRLAAAAMASLPPTRALPAVAHNALLSYGAAHPALAPLAYRCFLGLAEDDDGLRPHHVRHAIVALHTMSAAPEGDAPDGRSSAGTPLRAPDACWVRALRVCIAAQSRGVLSNHAVEQFFDCFPAQWAQGARVFDDSHGAAIFRSLLLHGKPPA